MKIQCPNCLKTSEVSDPKNVGEATECPKCGLRGTWIIESFTNILEAWGFEEWIVE